MVSARASDRVRSPYGGPPVASPQLAAVQPAATVPQQAVPVHMQRGSSPTTRVVEQHMPSGRTVCSPARPATVTTTFPMAPPRRSEPPRARSWERAVQPARVLSPSPSSGSPPPCMVSRGAHSLSPGGSQVMLGGSGLSPGGSLIMPQAWSFAPSHHGSPRMSPMTTPVLPAGGAPPAATYTAAAAVAAQAAATARSAAASIVSPGRSHTPPPLSPQHGSRSSRPSVADSRSNWQPVSLTRSAPPGVAPIGTCAAAQPAAQAGPLVGTRLGGADVRLVTPRQPKSVTGREELSRSGSTAISGSAEA